MHDLRESNGIVWRKFAGFNDDGIPGQQRRSELPGNQKERKVPRQNPGGDAQRAFKDQNIFSGAVALQDLAFITARPLGHIFDVVGGERDFHLRQLLDFSAFRDNQRADLFCPLTNPCRDLSQPSRAFNRRQRLPFRLSARSGVNGLTRLLRAAIRNTGEQFFGGRIHHINPCVSLPANKLTIDIHRVLYGCGHALLL